MNTEKYLDPYRFARDLDIDKYSILVAAGGDGTYHEVINGLLAREDGRKIPIAVIPNGSGNDLCSSIGIFNLDEALNYIIKGECIKLDTIRCLFDHESEDTLPEGDERYKFMQHADMNCGMGITGKINIGAEPYKKWFGKRSYEIATILEKLKGNFVTEDYEVEIDGQRLEGLSEAKSLMLIVANGKYKGGDTILNPFACLNDGLLDVSWSNEARLNTLMGTV